MKNKSVKYLVVSAAIAAIYAVLTIVVMPINYGPIQCRISEAMTVLPIITPAGIPGLFVGCLVANIVSPVGAIDMVVGSIASLIAALLTYKLRRNKWVAMLPPVLVNAVMIGTMLYYYYNVEYSLVVCMITVGVGQLVACYVLGIPLLKLLEKHKDKIGL